MALDPIVVAVSDALREYYSEDTEPPYSEEYVTLRANQAGYAVFEIVRNYTRGVGFELVKGVWQVDSALQAVIVSASSRYYATRAQGTMTFGEFTDGERAVLHQFRIRNA